MTDLFEMGFPYALRGDVFRVEEFLPKITYNDVGIGRSEQECTYLLGDGQLVLFPYRMYFMEGDGVDLSDLTQTQRGIYHAVYSRSCDGFVRERHVRALLKGEPQEWMFPYVLKLADEYVMEILECLYEELCCRETDLLTAFQEFCFLNLQQFLKSYDRMISYWNAFYRSRCYRFKDYVGRRLYRECFGYTRGLEKLRAKMK